MATRDGYEHSVLHQLRSEGRNGASPGVVRTSNQFTIHVQEVSETACTIVMYAAMLSVLFFAAPMPAINITQDEINKYKMPQPWAQTAMFCCYAPCWPR